MKTRQGFVSNSSSSSFIIRGSEVYPSIVEVAKAMIKIRDEDWERKSDTIKTLNKYAKIVDFKKLGIFFHSTNYDTFIYEVDGYYFISTCNNHPFYDAFTGQDYAGKLPEHTWEKLREYGISDEDSLEYKHPNIDFVNLDSDFIGRELNDTYICPDHLWDEIWHMKKDDGSYIFWCPFCKKEIKLDDQKDILFKIRILAGSPTIPNKNIEFLIKGRENVLKLKAQYPSYYIREEEFTIPTLTLEEVIEKLKL